MSVGDYNINRFAGHEEPIIVTGIPRSGIGIVASLLRAFGAWPGDSETDDKHGPNAELRDRIIRPYFRGIREAPTGRGVTGGAVERSRSVASAVAPVWRRRMLHYLHGHGYEGGPWIYWGGDASLAWPVWLEAFPASRWVIVRRDEKNVIASCMATRYIRDAVGDIPAWANSYTDRFEEIAKAASLSLECWPGRMFSGKLDAAKRLVTDLGMTWDDDRANDALSPALWASGVFGASSSVETGT